MLRIEIESRGQDFPCPNCGNPGVSAGVSCFKCGSEGIDEYFEKTQSEKIRAWAIEKATLIPDLMEEKRTLIKLKTTEWIRARIRGMIHQAVVTEIEKIRNEAARE